MAKRVLFFITRTRGKEELHRSGVTFPNGTEKRGDSMLVLVLQKEEEKGGLG